MAAGNVWFARPAKTGSSALHPKLDALTGCRDGSRIVGSFSHMEVRPPAGLNGAIVLRSPLERFVSAWHMSQSFAAAGDASCRTHTHSNGTVEFKCEKWPPDDKRWAINSSHFWLQCDTITKTWPTAERLQRLVLSGSPLKFARLLRSDARDRMAWLAAPTPPFSVSTRPLLERPRVLSQAACLLSCGRLCGFVPQVVYARHANFTACLTRLDSDVDEILDAEQTGCQHSIAPWRTVSADHSDGTRDAAESAELLSHVRALYAADWQLWERRCLRSAPRATT